MKILNSNYDTIQLTKHFFILLALLSILFFFVCSILPDAPSIETLLSEFLESRILCYILFVNVFCFSHFHFLHFKYYIVNKKIVLYVFLLLLLCLIAATIDIGISAVFIKNSKIASSSDQLILSLRRVLFLVMPVSILYSLIMTSILFKKNQLNLKNLALQSQLKKLQSQMSPHFLFNTLNTAYGTALSEEAGETAEVIDKIASYLRYSQLDAGIKISIETEFRYIEEYLILQKKRLPKNVITNFLVMNNGKSKLIYPMLLLPFIENVFKHGISSIKTTNILIHVTAFDDTVTLLTENDCFTDSADPDLIGIGISNTKSRLELLYPKRHSLSPICENNRFTIRLSIKI